MHRSSHVLPTAATLMGFCLVVQASLHVQGEPKHTYLDEFTAVITCLFMAACLFSYLSIRTANPKRSERQERMADSAFLAGLFLLLALIILISVGNII